MTRKERFIEYIEETMMNKLMALGLLAAGIGTAVLTKEGNLMIISLLIGIPLFLSKRNHID